MAQLSLRVVGVDGGRFASLREILNRARIETLARVREYRRQQEEDALPLPADDLDAARSLADVETHASLIERAEYRLKAIDAAFNRLERGRYGFCDQCGEEIPIARLRAMPFAVCCVDCQEKRDRRVRPGEGRVDEPSRYVWVIPDEMDESLETQDSIAEPEEGLAVRSGDPFGPEVGEFEQLPPAPTARRRGRPRKKEQNPEF